MSDPPRLPPPLFGLVLSGHILCGLLSGCGGGAANTTPSNDEQVESPPATQGESEVESEAVSVLDGRYAGQPPPQPPGAIGMSREYRFDGTRRTYEMTGYPSLAERGVFRIVSGDEPRIRFNEVRRCGPCEVEGPNEDGPDVERVIRLEADGSSFTMDGWTFTRTSDATP